jgi:hypothetical protein
MEFSKHEKHDVNLSVNLSPSLESLISRAFCDNNAILTELRKIGEQIMSALTDFAAKANAALAEANTSLDNIVTDEAALAKSIADLQAQIAAGGSVLTPEDQAALDSVASTAAALATRTKGVADAVPDAITP